MIKHRSLCAMHSQTLLLLIVILTVCFSILHSVVHLCLVYSTAIIPELHAEHFAHLSRYRLSATQRSFRHTAAKWWNDLPEGVATSSTFSSDVYNYF